MTQNKHIDLLCSRRLLLGMVCILVLMGRQAYADESPLTFGIIPYQSHQQLISIFSPLRDYLQQASGQKLTIISAPDFKSFRDRTKSGEYDIVFTAPHFARLAEIDSQFQRVAITRYRVHSVILVAKDSPVRNLADLRGKTLAVPPATSMVYMLTMELLRSKGMEPGRDFTLHMQDNMQNAMVASLRGDSDAGTVGFASWSIYPQQDMLRVLAKTAEVPGLIIMAHPRVPKATVAKLSKALFTFGNTPEGKAYFASTLHGAWLPVDDATVRTLDRYLQQARD